MILLEAATQRQIVGLDVGLYRDYGSAQKLYIKKVIFLMGMV